MKIRIPTVHVLGSQIELKHYPQEFLNEVFAETSFPNPAYELVAKFSPWGANANIPPTLDFAKFTDDGLRLPRGMAAFLSDELRRRIYSARRVHECAAYDASFPKLRLELNDEQQKCISAFNGHLRRGIGFGNYLFLASTAAGKTILQATVAAMLRKCTLVICPTDQIMRAWYADLQKAFGLKPKQIGLIRATKFNMRAPFTLATPQTLGRRHARWDEINRVFGTVIVDEVQVVTAPKLFEFLNQSRACNMIGATATQNTRTGVNLHLRALMGRPLVDLNTYARDTQSSMRIDAVHLVMTDFTFVHQKDNIDWYQLGLALTTDEKRNALIVRKVHEEWLSGRVVLITTKLREHVTMLVEMLSEAGITNVNTITGSTNTNRFYTKKLLAAVEKRRVTCIVATQQAIAIGTNIPMLDSLHIAIPPANTRDFEQLLGRIRRKATGKEKASVTYYMDTKVGYMMHLYRRVVTPTFMRLRVPGYEG